MTNHLNRYAYCQGNPVKQNDPFGLCPQEQGGMTDRDWIHLGLSILGCIPVVGIAANIANAVLYFQEGDALNGLLSVAGALIGVGGVTAAIGAAKGICALTTVGQAIKTAGVAYTAGASAMQTIEAASKTFNMLKENDFQWNEEILLSAGQTALSLAGTIAGFKAVGSCINEAAALSASGLACFVAGTKVLTDKGFKNIEDIEAGDYVYSTSDKTGESGYKEVLQVFQKETEVVTHVFYEVEKEDGETRTEEIETTLNHLFWCEGEWKAAGTLKPDDKLTLADGSQVEVTEITYEDRHTTVYNMEVEDYHTYHVGEDGVWVHNTDGCGSFQTKKKVNTPSEKTKVINTPETKAPHAIDSADAINVWDDYLGPDTTNLNPRTGVADPNRIFSADGTKSIRFGPHEMNSIGTSKAHFHFETWTYDSEKDVMTITNMLQRMR